MKLELIDTAYMKDQQIKILKKALLDSNDIIADSGRVEDAVQSLRNVEAILKANEIEKKWSREVA